MNRRRSYGPSAGGFFKAVLDNERMANRLPTPDFDKIAADLVGHTSKEIALALYEAWFNGFNRTAKIAEEIARLYIKNDCV